MEVQASAALRGVGSGLNMTDHNAMIEGLRRLAEERLRWANFLEREGKRCKYAYTNLRDGILEFIERWYEKGNGHTWVELINDLEHLLVEVCPDVENIREERDGTVELRVDESEFPVENWQREHR